MIIIVTLHAAKQENNSKNRHNQSSLLWAKVRHLPQYWPFFNGVDKRVQNK